MRIKVATQASQSLISSSTMLSEAVVSKRKLNVEKVFRKVAHHLDHNLRDDLIYLLIFVVFLALIINKMSKLESLRDYAKFRILDDMVSIVKKHVIGDRDYLILVMDTSALKVFSSCCKLFDIYRAGLYHIERLEKKRKKYPNTNAIYLISPTKESIDRLIDDFAK